MILMAAGVMSCGDGRNSANTEGDTDNSSDRTELAEPDSTMTESDTTSPGDMDQRQDDNDMDRGESGTTGSSSGSQSSGSSDSRNQRDTIQ